jgi:DNA-binding NtrC family response regulator
MTEKLTPPRVLVVDDELLIRWALCKALTARGSDVREAADAKTAILVASEAGAAFDAVVLDLKLPDADDLSLLATLHARLPTARIVLMTAFGTEDLQAEALRLGAVRVVKKPFDVKALAAQVVEAHQGTH